jgi:hypothetical protein
LTPRELHDAARQMVTGAEAHWSGIWPRAAAFLARQALEAEVEQQLKALMPGAQTANRSVQLVCLREVHADRELAARVAWTWAALSEACHHYGYELPPTHAELLGWLGTIDALVGSGVG